MKLYDGKRTPSGRRARIFIREKQAPMPEIVDVDIAKKEHLEPAYARLNPKCRLPTLLLDDGTAGVAIEFMRVPRLEVPPACVHVARWFEGLKARPSWAL